MGTSINQRSPATPNWRAATTAYTNDAVSIERAVQEIWRAATNQPTGDLSRDLAAPIVAECLKIAITAASREEAAISASRTVAASGQASLAADIAQRAVIQSFRSQRDRSAAFTTALFAEAGNYLVSRDLPGYVGAGGRARTVSDSIAFKGRIREQIASRVSAVPRPPQLTGDLWPGYVKEVVRHLKGGA